MKKLFIILTIAALVFAATGCNDVNNPGTEDTSVTGKINKGSSVVDFQDAILSEDAAVNNAVTVENADFSGKILTVNVAGVTLKNLKNVNIVAAAGIGNGDLAIEDCSADSFTVAGGGSNSIHIKGTSTIKAVVVIKAAVHIVLEDTAATTTMKIETTGVSVQGSTGTTIETMQIAADVDTVSVSGGTISTITVSKSDTSTPTITVTGKVTITSAKTIDESTGTEKDGIFVVTDEAKTDGFMTSKITGAEEVTIKSAELETDTAVTKTAYETGDAFDYTGLSVKLTYSNNTSSTVVLTSANSKITGFDNTTKGSQSVSFAYNGIPVTGTHDITVTDTTKAYQTILDDAVTLLLNGQYDEGIAKITAAYESDKNDTTRMYYALAQLASISTDSSVKTLLTKNYGFTNYPAKLNSLFSTDWMKAYVRAKSVWCEDFASNPSGSYVRVNATEATSGGYSTWGYKEDSDGAWIDSNFSLADAAEDNSGSYLINTWAYYSITGKEADTSCRYSRTCTITKESSGYYVRVSATESSEGYSAGGYKYSDGNWIDSNSSLTNIAEDNSGSYLIYISTYQQITGKTADSDYLYTTSSGYSKYVSNGTPSYAPRFNLPDWFADTDVYKKSLINSAQSTQTVGYLLAANVITCNPDGYNTLVDNILNIFGTKFTTAKQLASELSEGSVVIPEKVISAFGLTDMLGDSPVKIGKSELNILIGAMELLQGSFQYISSYDLSVNILSLKASLNYSVSDNEVISLINGLANSSTFAVRNESAVSNAKSTLIDAIGLIMNSYEYITGNSSAYPDAAKEKIKMYGDIWYSCMNTARSAIKNDEVFYIPSSYPTGSAWPTTDTNASFGIDMSKVFTAGNFTNIFERKSDGSFQVYLKIYTEADATLSTLTSNSMPDLKTGTNYSIGLLLNKSILASTLPGLYQESTLNTSYFVPVYGSRSSSSESYNSTSSDTSD
ncbi:MAG: hypothetical protein WCR31_02000 [Treponema sp.]